MSDKQLHSRVSIHIVKKRALLLLPGCRADADRAYTFLEARVAAQYPEAGFPENRTLTEMRFPVL
ncbi:hypothetical protein KDH_65850 [Dictyobacter sp. S3.2.2.5]|uniref:GyrI-like small molecule binding domain-containing protein n=1 Tax=Dictyobacter halimunensis TaxID=3026934 RepID=A0ABQ6G4K8_9CHLR|nr:hypothetical protein KDH_65850 [Dictyobacter sp. S3.2.2.5]